ncbi:hypothetical protein REC12_06520 [Desulfosporosinus sp. PR]|nr:hypothetical protein [Desulfosporosinus sp. PR]
MFNCKSYANPNRAALTSRRRFRYSRARVDPAWIEKNALLR